MAILTGKNFVIFTAQYNLVSFMIMTIFFKIKFIVGYTSYKKLIFSEKELKGRNLDSNFTT